MSLFDSLGSQQKSQPFQNPAQALQKLRTNPAETLKAAGINIPNGMTNPQQIIQLLIQSGQVPQSRLTQVMQMMQGLRR